MTKDEIISAARQAGACTSALVEVTKKAITWSNLPPHLAYWLRVHCDQSLDAYAKARADVAACRDPLWAFTLRLDCRTLSKRTKRRIYSILQDRPDKAYLLRVWCNDLSRMEKRRYEAVAGSAPYLAFRLVTECDDLSSWSRRKLEAVVRKDAELAHKLRVMKRYAKALGVSVQHFKQDKFKQMILNYDESTNH